MTSSRDFCPSWLSPLGRDAFSSSSPMLLTPSFWAVTWSLAQVQIRSVQVLERWSPRLRFWFKSRGSVSSAIRPTRLQRSPADARAGALAPSVSISRMRRSKLIDCSTRVGSTSIDTRRTGLVRQWGSHRLWNCCLDAPMIDTRVLVGR